MDAASAEVHERGHISDIKTIVIGAMDAEEGTVYSARVTRRPEQP